MRHPHWPIFDIRVRTPRLELRPEWDAGLAQLAKVAAGGIHDPAFMPFSTPWTDQPPGELERSTYQWAWRMRAGWQPDDWHVMFLVLVDGRVVGTQGLGARHFATRRTVSTGSWLGRAHQGLGIGKEMRAAVLHFAFEGLGATRAESSAFYDNKPSLGVSRALGYRTNGDEVLIRRDGADRVVRLALSRRSWERHQPDLDVTIEGLDACRDRFFAEPAPATADGQDSGHATHA